MATHSIILAWRIPWTEEPGGLWYIGLQRVGHNWSNLARMHVWCFPRPLLSWDQFSGSGVPRPSHTHTLWSCLLAFWALSGNDPDSIWLITALKAQIWDFTAHQEIYSWFSTENGSLLFHMSLILLLVQSRHLEMIVHNFSKCLPIGPYYSPRFPLNAYWIEISKSINGHLIATPGLPLWASAVDIKQWVGTNWEIWESGRSEDQFGDALVQFIKWWIHFIFSPSASARSEMRAGNQGVDVAVVNMFTESTKENETSISNAIIKAISTHSRNFSGYDRKY